MPKISRETQIVRLMELYGSDLAVRKAVFDGTRQELTRMNKEHPEISADFTWMKCTDEDYARCPLAAYERVMLAYYGHKSNEWIDEHYRDNKEAIIAMLEDTE